MSKVQHPRRTYDGFIDRLLELDPRHSGNKYICPAHDDDKPSLSVNLEDGHILIHCFAGCDYKEVLAGLDMKASALFVGNGSVVREKTGKPPQPLPSEIEIRRWQRNLRSRSKWLAYWRKRGVTGKVLTRYEVGIDPEAKCPDDDRVGAFVFVYRKPDGTLLNVKRRWNARNGTEDKTFRLIAGQARGFLWPLDQLNRSRVALVEGEPDALRAISVGIPAVTPIIGAGGGINSVRNSAHVFEGLDVVVLAHADKGGRTFAEESAKAIVGYAKSVRVFDLFPSRDDGSDLCDWLDKAANTVAKLWNRARALPVVGREPEATGKTFVDPNLLPSGDDLFEDGKFIPPRLGRAIEKAGGLRIGPGKTLWRYDGGLYRPDGEEWMAQFTRDALGDDFREGRLRETRAFCKANYANQLPIQPSTEYINLANGILHWKEDPPRLAPHSPDIPSIIQIPIAWNPEARCPEIGAFLKLVLPDDCLSFLFEWSGYLLIPTSRMRRALMLEGPTETGKSTLLNLFSGFLGRQAVSHHSLHSICDDRFTVADLYGRLANICADLDTKSIQNSGTFNKIVAGDKITAERKYEHPFSFRPFTRLMFSANEPPGTSDQSDAYYKRWLLLPLHHQIPENKQDPSLEDRLLAPEELEGFLVGAIDGLRRLARRKRFRIPESMRKAAHRYRLDTDIITAFGETHFEQARGASIRQGEAYSTFESWCRSSHRYALSRQRFVAHVLERYPWITEGSRHGYPTFRNVKVRWGS